MYQIFAWYAVICRMQRTGAKCYQLISLISYTTDVKIASVLGTGTVFWHIQCLGAKASSELYSESCCVVWCYCDFKGLLDFKGLIGIFIPLSPQNKYYAVLTSVLVRSLYVSLFLESNTLHIFGYSFTFTAGHTINLVCYLGKRSAHWA